MSDVLHKATQKPGRSLTMIIKRKAMNSKIISRILVCSMKKLSDYRRENFKSESRIDLITLHRCQHLNSSSLRTSLLPFSPRTERLRLNTDVLIPIARRGGNLAISKASKFLNCPKAGENSFRAHDLNLEGYKIKCTLAYKIFSTLKNS